MKKLVSLIMVLALVLGLATVAFATDLVKDPDAGYYGVDGGGYIMAINDPTDTYTLTLTEAVTDAQIIVAYGFLSQGISVKIASDNEFTVNYGMQQNLAPNNGTLTFQLDMMGGSQIYLTAPAGTYTISFEEPTVGVPNAPFALDYYQYMNYAQPEYTTIEVKDTDENDNPCKFEFTVSAPADDVYFGGYYYTFHTGGTPYYIELSDVEVTVPEGHAVEGAELVWSVQLNTSYGNVDITSDEDEESVLGGDFGEFDYNSYAPVPANLNAIAGQYKDTNNDGWPELVGPAVISFALTFIEPEEGSDLAPYYESFNETPDIFRTTYIPASELVEDNYGALDYVYYQICNNPLYGGKLMIADKDAVIKYDGEYYTAADDDDNDDSVLTVNLTWDDDVWLIGFANLGDSAERYDVECDLLDGHLENPVDLVIGENKVSFDAHTDDPEVDDENYFDEYYFYIWTATEAGVLSISDLIAVIPEDMMDAYPENAEAVAGYKWFLNINTATDDPIIDGDSVHVVKGDVVTVCVYVEFDEDLWCNPAADVSFNASFMTEAEANPIRVNVPADLSGIDVPAGGTVYYSINSQLNGQILTIAVDENAVVTLNGKELKAENGVVAAELTGTPTNKLVVTNKGNKAASYVATINWPVGSESNPIEIKNSNELTGIDAAAGESVYYAINSQLNGQILTINVDDKTVVTLNGKEVKAEDGVVTATLEGTPVNALVVTNKGEKDASYTASIAYELGTEGNPIAVTTEKELNGTEIAAGEEVHYLLNSKMAGAVLSVKGDKAYVIVNGEKTEAKDGFIKLTLEAKGATISLVIGNAGEKAATVTLGYSDNPNTGDAGIMAPIAMALVSAMSTVALVIKKKEF